MIQFVCESCGRTKDPKESWILGLAADTLGVTSASREIAILQPWNAARAVDPLAVHFCSVACKDQYVNQLFADESPTKPTGKHLATALGDRRRARKQGTHTSRRKRAA
jgi:hypothetical protein